MPEFELAEDEKYNVQNEDEMPSISYSTHLSPHELTPLPATHGLDYQKVHYELENWTMFRTLPQMMHYDQSMTNLIKGLNNGLIKIPDWLLNINPPSLFAYYNTLPQWAREHPTIRSMVMAFEYH